MPSPPRRSGGCHRTILAGNDYVRDIGFPGGTPTRGVHATMQPAVDHAHVRRFRHGRGTNARFRYLEPGPDRPSSVAFDIPTLYGYDGSARALGEFGKCGVAVSSPNRRKFLDQFHGRITDFDDHPFARGDNRLGHVHGGSGEAGLPAAQLGGTPGTTSSRNTSPRRSSSSRPSPSMRMVTDTVEFGTREAALWNTISISGYHIREGGSTAAQELAFTLADGSPMWKKQPWRAGWTWMSLPCG